MIKVKLTKNMGRGIFATKPIKKNTVIETNHLLIYPNDEREKCKCRMTIMNYDFEIGRNKCGIALGLISLLNHNENPNTDYIINGYKETITIKALRDIKRGEQLFIDYGYDPNDWS